MNIVLLLAHSIEEYDQVRLLTSLGYDVFSIGAYSDPAHPGDSLRPPLPDAPDHPELRDACHRVRSLLEEKVGPPKEKVDWAKYRLPTDVLDWADVIVCHHFEHTWLVPQWANIRHKRVVWRTVGQSVENNERVMAPLRRDGLQIVRYSPKEANIPGYLGADALIRFYKDPDEYAGWTGESPQVLNITQHLQQRDPYTNWRFWEAATAGLARTPAGPGSDEIGGTGTLTFEAMTEALRRYRAYLYTGTQPASYTLGLIEALMTGIPVVSIGPSWMDVFPYGPDLFEGHELSERWSNDPVLARADLVELLSDFDLAAEMSALQRARAVATFGREPVAAAWRAFLG